MSFEQPKFEERPEIKTDKTEQQGEKIVVVENIREVTKYIFIEEQKSIIKQIWDKIKII